MAVLELPVEVRLEHSKSWEVPTRSRTHRKDDSVMVRNRDPRHHKRAPPSSVGVCSPSMWNSEAKGLKIKRWVWGKSQRDVRLIKLGEKQELG